MYKSKDITFIDLAKEELFKFNPLLSLGNTDGLYATGFLIVFPSVLTSSKDDILEIVIMDVLGDNGAVVDLFVEPLYTDFLLPFVISDETRSPPSVVPDTTLLPSGEDLFMEPLCKSDRFNLFTDFLSQLLLLVVDKSDAALPTPSAGDFFIKPDETLTPFPGELYITLGGAAALVLGLARVVVPGRP